MDTSMDTSRKKGGDETTLKQTRILSTPYLYHSLRRKPTDKKTKQR